MGSPIHIAALVSYQVYPAKMGGQKGIAEFYKYLSQLLNVSVVSTKNNQFPSDGSARYFPLLSNSRSRYANVMVFFAMRKLIKENHITHLIIEHPYYGWLGFLLKKFCKITLIVHSHNIEALRFKSTGKWWWGILWAYEKWTHRQANLSFFISDEDRLFATNKYGLSPSACHTITYGFELEKRPDISLQLQAKKTVRQEHQISLSDRILFFNGTLDYKPNLDAVDYILHHINPMLLQAPAFSYKIIICGKNLPPKYNNLKEFKDKNIIYAGFVNDINTYFMGSDIFINPVTDGGGIKTKLVEALGNNLSSISTISGAIGIDTHITGNKLELVADGDWKAFVGAIIQCDTGSNIPDSFFNYFYWGNIAKKAASLIEQYNPGTTK